MGGEQDSPTINNNAEGGIIKTNDEMNYSLGSLNNSGCTLLHMAAWHNDVNQCQDLIDRGADVDSRQSQGKTPIMLAVVNGSVETVELLLQYCNLLSSKQIDNTESTVLHIAIESNQPTVVALLESHAASLLAATNEFGETALHVAARCDSEKTLSVLVQWDSFQFMKNDLLEKECSISLSDRRMRHSVHDNNNSSSESKTHKPLQSAAHHFNENAIKILLAEGANKDSLSWSDCHEAIFSNEIVIPGMHPCDKDSLGLTAIHFACGFGKKNSLLQILDTVKETKVIRLKEKFDELSKAMQSGSSINHLTQCNSERESLIEELSWDYSRCLDLKDDYGRSPLQIAAQTRSTDCLEILISRGVDVNVCDNYGWTALHHTAENGDTRSTSLLLTGGAFVNGKTPLLSNVSPVGLAAGKGHLEVLSLLLTCRDVTLSVDTINQIIDSGELSSLRMLSKKLTSKFIKDGPLGHALTVGSLRAVEVLLSLEPELSADLISHTLRSEVLSDLNKLQIVHFFIGQNVSPDSNSILTASLFGCANCLELLLQSDDGKNRQLINCVGSISDFDGLLQSATPLQAAIVGKQKEVVMLLLSLGADPNIAGESSLPPLTAAMNTFSESNLIPVVKSLLASGASPNESVVLGKRIPILALNEAVMLNSEALCRVLHKAGADLESRKGGLSPLLLACKEGKWEFATLMLNLGAAINVFTVDDEDYGEVGPLWFALQVLRERMSLNFVIQAISELCPPSAEDQPDCPRNEGHFTLFQMTATRHSMRSIKAVLTGNNKLIHPPPYLIENKQTFGSNSLYELLFKLSKSIESLVFVDSRKRALVIASELSYKKRALGAGGSPIPARTPPKSRVIVIYRCDTSVDQFNCVY